MSKKAQSEGPPMSLLLGGAATGEGKAIALELPLYLARGQVMVPLRPIIGWLDHKADRARASVRWLEAEAGSEAEVADLSVLSTCTPVRHFSQLGDFIVEIPKLPNKLYDPLEILVLLAKLTEFRGIGHNSGIGKGFLNLSESLFYCFQFFSEINHNL